MKTLHDITLKDLLPANLSKDETVSKAASALDPHLNLMAGEVRFAYVYSRLDELTSEQIDHLAVQFHVAAWNSSWSRDRKLAIIKATVETKRKRGTVLAVKDAVATFLNPFQITEWWQSEPKGEPFTFDVQVPLDDIGRFLSEEDQDTLGQLIYEAKSIRSHGSITLKKKLESDFFFSAGALGTCVYKRLQGRWDPFNAKLREGSAIRPAVFARIGSPREVIEVCIGEK